MQDDKLTQMFKDNPKGIAKALEDAYLTPLAAGAARTPEQVLKELRETKAWKDAYNQSGDPATTIKMGLRWKKHSDQTVEAFLVSFEDVKDFSTSPPTTTGRRPIIMLANGERLRETPINTLDPVKSTPGTRLQIHAVDVLQDIYLGAFQVRLSGKSEAVVTPHDAPFPAIPVAQYIAEALEFDAKQKPQTNTIRMESQWDPAICTGNVGRSEEIRYYPKGKYPNENLSATVHTHDGVALDVALDAEDIRRQFPSLTEASTDSDYRFALQGEPVLLIGKVNTGRRTVIAKMPAGVDILKAINEQVAQGLSVTYKNHKRLGTMQALVLNRTEPSPQGSRQAKTFVLGNVEFYKVRQEPVKQDNGQQEVGWVGYTPLANLNLPYSFEAKAKSYSNDDGSGVINEGARAVFLNRLGDQRLPADDPFAVFAAQGGA